VLAAGWPVWCWLSGRLSDEDELVGCLLALGSALALVWRERGAANSGRPIWPASVALLLYAAAYPWTPDLGRALLYALALGAALPALGAPRATAWWAGALLLLAVPVVPTAQFIAGYPLRALVAEGAALLIRLQGTPVEARGALLEWAGGTVAVDAPCSGIKMLWSGAWLACAAGGWLRLGARAGLALLAGTALLVVAGNIVRAAALFQVEAGRLPDAAWMHEGVGLAVFATVCAGVIALAAWIARRPTPNPKIVPCASSC
jgi:exosortase/archaeosortase family protein